MSESSPSDTPLAFEVALERLQGIVRDLEEGKLGLEQSLARFEEGIGLLRDCHRTLEQAEQRIEVLIGIDANGVASTRPFDAAATVEPEDSSRPKPGRRRPAATVPSGPRNEPPSEKPDDQRLF